MASRSIYLSNAFGALLRKSFKLQIRQKWTNICQILIPTLLILIVGIIALTTRKSFEEFNKNYPSQNYFYGGYSWTVRNPTTQQCYWPVDPYNPYVCGPWMWGYFVNPQGGSAGQATSTGEKTGFLGEIEQMIFQHPIIGNKSVPYFEQAMNAYQIDDLIFELLPNLTDNWWVTPQPNDTSSYKLPTYGIIFDELNVDTATLKFTLQVPGSNRYEIINSYPKETPSSHLFDMTVWYIHNAFLNWVLAAEGKGNMTIRYGKTSMLEISGGSPLNPDQILGFFGVWFIPIALTFLLPAYVYTIVMEKQERLLEMMKIMGMTMSVYWGVNYLFFYLIYLVIIILVSIIGEAFSIPFFTSVSPASWIILFLLWGHAQIANALFLSAFFNKQRTATIVCYMIVLVVAMGGICINIFSFQHNQPGIWYMFYPPLAFIRGVYIISSSLYDPLVPPMTTANVFSGNSQIAEVYYYLIVETFVYCILAGYFEMVLPREHGVNYSPIFPLKWLISCIKSNNGKRQEDATLIYKGEVDDEEEDPDCAKERAEVHRNEKNYLVRIIDLTKQYVGRKGETKLALSKFSLGIESGECFGLLGPNGAGKSTLINTLCGMIKPTAGTAFVAGFDITKEMYRVHQVIGYCPQHNALWNDLTIVEHLLFYVRLKGLIPTREIASHVNQVIEQVGLKDSGLKKVSELSGGMKRRLSIAIALVGNPKLILLDEPTTGLDPETRRLIWDMINEQKVGKSIILTTHNMEEADVLCTRIGIVSKGKLNCIGSQLYLKNRFGEGFHLSLTTTPDNLDNVKRYVSNLFPNAILESCYSGILSYQIARKDMQLGKLLQDIRRSKEEFGIKEWAINQTSLEEVFLKIIQEDQVTD